MLHIDCEGYDLRELLTIHGETARQLGQKEEQFLRAQEELRALKMAALPSPTGPFYNMSGSLSDLVYATRTDQKILAIKVIRSLTGLGLKESKDLFEDALIRMK